MALLYPGFVQQAGEILNSTVAPNSIPRADGTFVDPSEVNGVMEYIDIRATAVQTTDLTAGNNVKFTSPTISGTLPFNSTTGRFTLLANKTYELFAAVPAVFTGLSNFADFQWWNVTNNFAISASTNGISTSDPGTFISQPITSCIYSPGTNVEVELRIRAVETLFSIGLSDGNGLRLPFAIIKQLGSSGQILSALNVQNSNPNIPTSGLTVFPDNRFNPLGDLSYKDSAGRIFTVQKAYRFAQTHSMAAVGNGTGTYSNGLTVSATGTATARNITTTSKLNATKRLGYVSAATAGSSAGPRHALAQYFRNNGSGLGGYRLTMTFGVSGFQTGMRVACGMTASTGAFANAEPNTFLNFIGIIKDGADTNYHIAHNDGTGTCTKINLGANFPATASNQAWIRLTIVALPGTPVYYYVENLSNNITASGTITVDLPADTALLCPQIWANNAAVAAAVGIDFGIVCIETLY